jgi:hypothetical protein
MIKKSILTIATISAGLFLSTNLQALDLYQATDTTQLATEATNTQAQPDRPKHNKKRLEQKKERREARKNRREKCEQAHKTK